MAILTLVMVAVAMMVSTVTAAAPEPAPAPTQPASEATRPVGPTLWPLWTTEPPSKAPAPGPAPTPTLGFPTAAPTSPAPPPPAPTTAKPTSTTTAEPTPTTAKPTPTTAKPTPTTAKPTPTTVKPTPTAKPLTPAPTPVPVANHKAPAVTIAVSALAAGSSSSGDEDEEEDDAAPSCDPHYENWNATTQQCDCKSGFSGMGCQMCTTNQVCQNAFAPKTPTTKQKYTCEKGLAYHYKSSATKTYDCDLAPSLQSIFADGAMAVHCDRWARKCTAVVYKRQATLRGEHVIHCELTKCDFPTGGKGDGDCGRIDCKCGKSCSAFTKAIVEQSLSGKPANVRVTNGTQLAIEIEDSPIPLAATCRAAACELDPSGGSDSGSGSGSGSGGGDSIWTSGLFLTLLACGVMVVVLLLGVCCCSCCVTTRFGTGRKLSSQQIEREISALTSTSGKLLAFTRVNCRAQDPTTKQSKRILSDLSGTAHRGQVLGLLGPSGSGKTSLLNALAAVENGKCQLTGEVQVDKKKIGRNYRRIAAYVQQDDSLFATLSVRECLTYSAELRLPSSVPDVVKREMVSRILTELNLGHVEHARIGSSGGAGGGAHHARGISGGERRRVSIGMELVTSPQILFLDEPTSGLDSSSANSVVQLVKELASHGRIVVLSIHQPSAKAFMLLDEVVLLAKGKMLYNGPPQKAKRHFESIGFKCPENENVADFILDIASNIENIPMARAAFVAKQSPVAKQKSSSSPSAQEEGEENRPAAGKASAALSSYFRSPAASESSPFMNAEDISLDTPRVHEMMNQGMMPGTPGAPATPAASRRSPTSPLEDVGGGSGSPSLPAAAQALSDATLPPKRSIWIELRVVFHRTALNILRHRSLLFLHLLLSVVLALFGGLIFNHVTNDLAGFQNRSGAFYFILTFFGFASMSSMDLFIAERGIFLRETGAMYYGAFSYFVAKAVLDTLLLRVLPAAIFASIFYWLMGLQATLAHFAMFQATLVLFNIAAGSISILVGVLSRNVGTANLTATVVFLVMLLFGGFLLNSQTMPKTVAWLKHFSIFSYAFEILMTNELKGLLLKFDAPGYPSVPVYGDVFLKTLGMDYANRYYDLLALAIIATALQVLAYLFLSLQVPVRQELVEEQTTATSPDGKTDMKTQTAKEIEPEVVTLGAVKKPMGNNLTDEEEDDDVELNDLAMKRDAGDVV